MAPVCQRTRWREALDRHRDRGHGVVAVARPSDEGERVLLDAYGWLELIVGIIAVTLPVILPVVDLDLHGSISSYYYERPGAWFVGSLFALGVFFLSYEYPPRAGFRTDFVFSVVASVAVIGVALFPTSSEGEAASGGEELVARVHVGCASITFLLLAFFCLRFTRSLDQTSIEEDALGTLRRLGARRGGTQLQHEGAFNFVFRSAAIVIVGCLLAIGLVNWRHWEGDWVFWLEALMVWAFGISWLARSRQRRIVRKELEPLAGLPPS